MGRHAMNGTYRTTEHAQVRSVRSPRDQTSVFAHRRMPYGQNLLQRKASCACGGSCPRCQEKSNSLRVSQPNDAAEIEADRIADTVMRMSEPKAHRKVDGKEELNGEHQRAMRQIDSLDLGSRDGSELAVVGNEVLRSPGQALDPSIRSFMEPRFERNFTHVRVHTDASAAESAKAVHARAFTVGQHIFFGAGFYSPTTDAGKRLLAHELTHTIHQTSIAEGKASSEAFVQRATMEDDEGKKADSCEGTSRHGPGEFRTIRNDSTAKLWEISNFDIAKHFLKPEHKKNITDKILTPAILDLVKSDGWQVWVNGNASTTGGEEFNKNLSKLRAICTTLFLLGGGMPAGTKVTGTGEAGAHSRLRKEGSSKSDDVEAAEDRSVQIMIVSTKAPSVPTPEPEAPVPDCPTSDDLRFMFEELDKNCGILLLGEAFTSDLACGEAIKPLACILIKGGGVWDKRMKELADKCCTFIPDQQTAEKTLRQLNACIMGFMIKRVPELWPECSLSESDINNELEEWREDLVNDSMK